jgi:hypothetical protein
MDPASQPAAPEERPLLIQPYLAQELAQHLADEYRQVAKDFADMAGQPLGSERMSLKEQIDLWNKRDPRQDPYQLSQAGKNPTEIRDMTYPGRAVLLQMLGPNPKDRATYAKKMRSLSDRAEYDYSDEEEDPYVL